MRFYLLVAITMLAIIKPAFSMVDENVNGMSDVWERKYQVFGISAYTDLDGDGKSNLSESLAGTDPTDAQSFFPSIDQSYRPVSICFQWESIEGVSYQLKQSSGLTAESWVNEGDPIVGLGGVMTSRVSLSSSGSKFYRVEVVNEDARAFQQQIGVIENDSDGDGQSDLVEIFSGTDAFSSDSRWDQSAQIRTGSSSRITWSSEWGKKYQIKSRESVMAPWVDEGAVFWGSGKQMEASFLEPGLTAREYTISVVDADSDGDGLNDWEEGQLGLDSKRIKTDSLGPGDLTRALEMLGESSVVTIAASVAVANITQMEDGKFEITRSSGVDEITVLYSITGSATAGADYVSLSGSVIIPFGESSAIVRVMPNELSELSLTESVIMTLQPSHGYVLGEEVSQQINVIKEVAINVRDYGAVGDGVTDDTSAIQAAIVALESSAVHNTLYFPSGKYRLASVTYTPHSAGTSNYRLLKLGNLDLAGRDIIIRGGDGAILYSTVSPLRVKMLLVMGSFRSMLFSGVKWEKIETPLEPRDSNTEPNGAAGVTLVAVDDRELESFVFEKCEFVNCHRSITIAPTHIEKLGKLQIAGFYECTFLNPYGANTIDSQTPLGGGQQVYVSGWVKLAEYRRNYFDGAGDQMNESNSPGGRFKDGSHFGSPLKLVFQQNIVRRMGIEAVDQTNDHNRLGGTLNAFTLPDIDGVTTVRIDVKFDPSTVQAGQHINFRVNSRNTVLRIISTESNPSALIAVNDGFEKNYEPGTSIPSNTPCFLQELPPTEALVTYNLIDDGAIGIVVNSRALVYKNVLYNSSVTSYEEPHTPMFPADKGLVIDRNVIVMSNQEEGQFFFEWNRYIRSRTCYLKQ